MSGLAVARGGGGIACPGLHILLFRSRPDTASGSLGQAAGLSEHHTTDFRGSVLPQHGAASVPFWPPQLQLEPRHGRRKEESIHHLPLHKEWLISRHPR